MERERRPDLHHESFHESLRTFLGSPSVQHVKDIYGVDIWVEFRSDNIACLTYQRHDNPNTPSEFPLFGMERSLGAVIIPSSAAEDIAEVQRRIGASESRRAVVSYNELSYWNEFYKQIVEQGILRRVGEKSLIGFSGLERTTPEQHEKLWISITSLFSNPEVKRYIERNGAILEFSSRDGDETGLDGVFYSRKEKRAFHPVPLFAVRRAYLQGEILIKSVLLDPIPVIGMVIRKPGETERSAWERAWRIEESFLKEGNSVAVLLISDGQVSLMNKLGCIAPVRAYDKQAEDQLPLSDVLRFLYLGKSNIHPGILATREYGMSLPRVLDGSGIDLIFQRRDKNGRIHLVPIDNVLVHNLGKRKRGGQQSQDFMPQSSVIGITVVPEKTDPKDIAKLGKELVASLRRYFPVSLDATVLMLTPSLFEEWKRRGTLFLPTEELDRVLKETPRSQAREYGYDTTGKNGKEGMTISYVEFILIWRGPKIGDMQYMVIEHYHDGSVIVHDGDCGSVHKNVPEMMKDITGRQGLATLVRQKLDTGELSMYPGRIPLPYLLASTAYWPALTKSGGCPSVRYVRAELYRRSNPDDLAQIIGKEKAGIIFQYGEIDSRVHQDKRFERGIIALSHAHDDHDGNIGMLDGPLIGIWQTIAHERAKSNHAPTFQDRTDRIARVDTAIAKGGKRSYDAEPRTMFPIFIQGEEVRISQHISVRFYFVDHSIEASWVGWHTPFGNVLFLGDMQPGPWTTDAIQAASGQEYLYYIAEATNPPDTEKASAHISPEHVYDNMVRIMSRENSRNNLIVIQAPPNHLDRLRLIAEACRHPSVNRRLVVGYRAADIIEHLRSAKLTSPLYAYGRDDVFTPRIGIEYSLYTKPLATIRPWQRYLENIARQVSADGAIDIWKLQQVAGDVALVLSVYDSPYKQLSGGSFPGVIGIRSSPFPYQSKDKEREFAARWYFGKEDGTYYASHTLFGDGWRAKYTGDIAHGLHSGGHGTFLEMMEIQKQLIVNNPHWQRGGVVTICYVHGLHTRIYARKAKEWFQSQGIDRVRCVGEFDHYRPDDPFRYPGHRIVLR